MLIQRVFTVIGLFCTIGFGQEVDSTREDSIEVVNFIDNYITAEEMVTGIEKPVIESVYPKALKLYNKYPEDCKVKLSYFYIKYNAFAWSEEKQRISEIVAESYKRYGKFYPDSLGARDAKTFDSLRAIGDSIAAETLRGYEQCMSEIQNIAYVKFYAVAALEEMSIEQITSRLDSLVPVELDSISDSLTSFQRNFIFFMADRVVYEQPSEKNVKWVRAAVDASPTIGNQSMEMLQWLLKYAEKTGDIERAKAIRKRIQRTQDSQPK